MDEPYTKASKENNLIKHFQNKPAVWLEEYDFTFKWIKPISNHKKVGIIIENYFDYWGVYKTHDKIFNETNLEKVLLTANDHKSCNSID